MESPHDVPPHRKTELDRALRSNTTDVYAHAPQTDSWNQKDLPSSPLPAHIRSFLWNSESLAQQTSNSLARVFDLIDENTAPGVSPEARRAAVEDLDRARAELRGRVRDARGWREEAVQQRREIDANIRKYDKMLQLDRTWLEVYDDLAEDIIALRGGTGSIATTLPTGVQWGPTRARISDDYWSRKHERNMQKRAMAQGADRPEDFEDSLPHPRGRPARLIYPDGREVVPPEGWGGDVVWHNNRMKRQRLDEFARRAAAEGNDDGGIGQEFDDGGIGQGSSARSGPAAVAESSSPRRVATPPRPVANSCSPLLELSPTRARVSSELAVPDSYAGESVLAGASEGRVEPTSRRPTSSPPPSSPTPSRASPAHSSQVTVRQAAPPAARTVAPAPAASVGVVNRANKKPPKTKRGLHFLCAEKRTDIEIITLDSTLDDGDTSALSSIASLRTICRRQSGAADAAPISVTRRPKVWDHLVRPVKSSPPRLATTSASSLPEPSTAEPSSSVREPSTAAPSSSVPEPDTQPDSPLGQYRIEIPNPPGPYSFLEVHQRRASHSHSEPPLDQISFNDSGEECDYYTAWRARPSWREHPHLASGFRHQHYQ